MEQVSQKLLLEQYRSDAERNISRPDWRSVGFRVYSQHDEDGYLLFIFSTLGFKSRKVVEICCGNGRESNTANLIANHRCIGTLFDADDKNCTEAQTFYSECKDTTFWPPSITKAWVTAENVNQLLLNAGAAGDVDLLSLDIDGIDYWLFRAINVIRPRVIVTEINHLWGPKESVTVPYSPDFKAVFTEFGSDYAGASISAFVKLARHKNYRLVGANSICTNAFFVSNDCRHDWLPEADPVDLFWHPRAKFGREFRFPAIKDMEWVKV